jgi:sialate O-acetylesterase
MKYFIISLFVFFQLCAASAQVRLPRLIRDSMVLQRDAKINVWGWAAAGEKINIKFNNKTLKATAGTNGKWAAQLPSMKAGGPYTMQIDASNRIVLKDILIGDVWFCSGQSNMVHQMDLHKETYADDIANAKYPQIRHFFIPTLTDLQGPVDDLPAGNWKEANPKDVLQFSAVAYFFARAIHEKYHVPIGLINASVGGTPIEAWTSEEGLKEFPNAVARLQKNKDTAYVNSTNRAAFTANANRASQNDKGLNGAIKWYDTVYVPKGWRNIHIPGYWEDQGVKDLDGIVWYRKEIDIPASMTGIPAKVYLGRIVDADFLYVNGVQAGNTTYQYPQRRYNLPAGLLKPGKNIFVVRVINNFGKGGFVPDKPYAIAAGNQTIDLKGDWQYKVGDAFVPFQAPVSISFQNQPAALYNAMVAPVINYTIKGVLWYQGESNTGNAAEYEKLLPALIADWRKLWKQGDIPFLYVQLPGFMDVQYLPSQSSWAVLRKGQLKTLSVPNTGMAVAIDLGEWNDVHPDNKKDVGLRLALAAQTVAYGEKNIVHSGPIYKSAQVEGNRVRISFDNAGSGLQSIDGEQLSQFAIAGADKKFVWASARIEGDKVIVWNETITAPAYVRYAWADNPAGANLFNKEELPASPFETEELKIEIKPIANIKGLKEYYKDYFPIGVAVSPRSLKTDEAQLILQQFNSITAENAMKMGPVHPFENEYNWRGADSIAAFAKRHGLKMRGHALCWHQQSPRWFFTDSAGKTVSKEVLLQRLKDHITTVVKRYKGTIYAWDVVNEAISDKKDEFYRNSEFYKICGEEYIVKAFQWAHEADPDALLFYNDYNEIDATKREKIYRLVKQLKDAGVPIHGLGLQGHWAINEPSKGQLDSTLSRFAQLGVTLQITELDISVYAKEHNARDRKPEDTNTAFTSQKEQQQLEVYKMCFELFRKYKNVLSGVTFWNISDRDSWLDNFPVPGRKDYPLLFDKELKPKKVFWEVVKF